MINDCARMQLNIIMKRYHKMKDEKNALSVNNNVLQAECRTLRDRHQKSEKHKQNLIKLCNESSQRNESKIHCLKRDVNKLKTIIEEQNNKLENNVKTDNERTKEINALKAEVQMLKKKIIDINLLKKELDNVKKERDELKNQCLLNHVTKSKSSKLKNNFIKKEEGVFGLVKKLQNFSHPSFEDDTVVKNKKRKNSSFCKLRWSDKFNGDSKKKKDSVDSSTSSDTTFSKEKKRKLYCSNDDVQVDLSNDEQ